MRRILLVLAALVAGGALGGCSCTPARFRPCTYTYELTPVCTPVPCVPQPQRMP